MTHVRGRPTPAASLSRQKKRAPEAGALSVSFSQASEAVRETRIELVVVDADTAEIDTGGGNICWYVTYGPARSPELVVAVVMEGAGWAAADALPVGRTVLERYLLASQD